MTLFIYLYLVGVSLTLGMFRGMYRWDSSAVSWVASIIWAVVLSWFGVCYVAGEVLVHRLQECRRNRRG